MPMPLPDNELPPQPRPEVGPRVEDATRVGGVDEHGRPVIRTKPVDAPVKESADFRPTDARESE